MRKGIIKRIDIQLAQEIKDLSMKNDISERQASRDIANAFRKLKTRGINDIRF